MTAPSKRCKKTLDQSCPSNWGRSSRSRMTLKFFVSSCFSHCSAADKRKFPLHPLKESVDAIRRIPRWRTFPPAVGDRFTRRALRSEEEQVYMRVDLRNNGMRNWRTMRSCSTVLVPRSFRTIEVEVQRLDWNVDPIGPNQRGAYLSFRTRCTSKIRP